MFQVAKRDDDDNLIRHAPLSFFLFSQLLFIDIRQVSGSYRVL